jgi:hypothetical protein
MIPRPVLGLFRSNAAVIGTPVKGEVTSSSIAVTGQVAWYKGNATWGVAYKAHGASSYTHSSSTSQSNSKTINSLSAETKYDIALYVKYQGVYQYGPVLEVTTEAAAPAETPTT